MEHIVPGFSVRFGVTYVVLREICAQRFGEDLHEGDEAFGPRVARMRRGARITCAFALCVRTSSRTAHALIDFMGPLPCPSHHLANIVFDGDTKRREKN